MMIKFRVIIIRGQPTHFAKLENNVEEISQVVHVLERYKLFERQVLSK